jgi:hypothetical protein
MTDLLAEINRMLEGDIAVVYSTTEEYDYNAFWRACSGALITPKIEDFKYDAPKVEKHTVVVEGYYHLHELLEETGDEGILTPFGMLYFVDSYGGEGEGDQYWYVFKVAGPVNRFFKVDGYYQSYSGGEYDNLYEVFPKQVQVTQWEA